MSAYPMLSKYGGSVEYTGDKRAGAKEVASACVAAPSIVIARSSSSTLLISSVCRAKLPDDSLNGFPSAKSQDIGSAFRAYVGAIFRCSGFGCQWQIVEAR